MQKQKRVARKRTAKLSAPMKKAVRALIHEDVEDKYTLARNTNANYPAQELYTAGIVTSSDFRPILPVIAQGDGLNDRIGNQIKPKALIVKFTITATGAPTTNSSEMIWGRLMVLQAKNCKYTSQLISTVSANNLLDLGSAAIAYTGSPGDNNWRINRRQFTVTADKLLKIQRGFGTVPKAGNVVPYIGDAICVNPLSQHQVTVRIPCPKTLKYMDDAEVYPQNFAPFFAFGYNMPNQVNPGAGEIDYRVAISWTSHFTFEDA